MNKKVILLTDYYFPNNSANGLCISRIGSEMLKMGYEVHVIAYQSRGEASEEMIDGIIVHRVKPQFFYHMRDYYYKNTNTWQGKICWKLALFGRRTKKILLMYWYPLTSPIAVRRYIKKIKQVAEKNDVKNIVAGYNPFEAAVASAVLKKRGNYKIIAYFMDTFTMTANAKNSKIIYNRGRYWEERIFKSVDFITNFPLYKEHFETEKYEKYRGKMGYADVPVDFDELDNVEVKKDDESVNLVYTGSMKMGEREPNYLLKLFNELEESISSNWNLHFYGKGNADSYIEQFSDGSKVFNHGYVSFEELREARKSADFMVNIGSKREVILPSRLLEHIASGKPIIHINYREDDPCVLYLAKHPCALIINEKDNFEDNLIKIKEFIIKYNKTTVSKEKIKKLYYTNSAEYIAKLFEIEFMK